MAEFPTDRDGRVDEAIRAYLEEADAGRAPDPRSFLARYPDLAADLRAFLDDYDHAGQLIQDKETRRQGDKETEKLPDTPLPSSPGLLVSLSPCLPPAVGGYRPLRLLGEGGMGRVYEAEGPDGRRVALKLIAPSFAKSPNAAERFRQEGRLASQIAHPRCVFVHAADTDAGQPYIVMELMAGGTLKQFVEAKGPLAPADAVARTLDLVEGLEEAHRLGVVHRDVKPANCYLGADGRLKVGDFGLARSLTAGPHLTQTGQFVGTPLFAAPEQLKGEPLDARADVYSAAATLYYLLTGRAPFQDSDGTAAIAKAASEPPPPPRRVRPDVPAALERVVLRGLERQRERRYQTLDEFREALLPLLPGRLTFAGLGLRFGAYLLDCVPFVLYGEAVGFWHAGDGQHLSFGTYLSMVLPAAFYFWLTEGLWGCSPGKWLVRLRVTRADGVEPPGPWRALGRYVALLILCGLVSDLALYAVLDRSQQLAFAMGHLAGTLVGVVAVLSTMRKRNGYRGLHEFLSGTRVVQLPPRDVQRGAWGAERAAGRGPWAALHVPDLPKQLGPLTVRGALRWDDVTRLLLAEDEALGRPAWVWLRPRDAGPLPEARRGLARPARLRWLASGEEGPWRWDAFVAPAGEPLADGVAARGPLGWSAARRVLEDLAEELESGAADGTEPAALSAGQVWVRPPGRAVLLDAPPAPSPPTTPLGLAREVAVLALEGATRPPGAEGGPVRAALPLHARAVLDRLTGPAAPYESAAALRADLATAGGGPAAVTPALRALHVVLSAALLSVGLAVFVVWCRIGAFACVLELDRQLLHARAALHALDDPAAGERVRGQMVRDREELSARLDSLAWMRRLYRQAAAPAVGRPFGDEDEPLAFAAADELGAWRVTRTAFPGEDPLSVGPEDLRRVVARAEEAEAAGGWVSPGFPGALLFSIGMFPALWVLSAFVFRGGVGLRLAGLALVRRDGRDAGRLRCAWRALLVWGTVFGWLALVLWLDVSFPFAVWLGPTLQVLTVALLFGYVALALRFPERGPHDYLVGTVLVPR